MDVINQALIMAAGRGNRMRPLTDVIPKPMIPYNGDTLIGNSLKMLNEKVACVHVTVGYKKAMLSEYLMMKGVDTIINTEGHGNAWWISNTVMRFVDEPVLVLTTDNITDLNLEFLSKEYSRLGNPACMLVPVQPIQGVEGDYIHHKNGVVTAVSRNDPSEIYCSGIQVLNPNRVWEIIDQQDEFYFVWNALIKKNELMVSEIYPNHWFSIDTLEQLAQS